MRRWAEALSRRCVRPTLHGPSGLPCGRWPGSTRARWRAWLAQAVGGALGISAGALLLHGFGAGVILTAAAAGVISGMVGGVGPSAPAFGMMLSVGVAFGQDVGRWREFTSRPLTCAP